MLGTVSVACVRSPEYEGTKCWGGVKRRGGRGGLGGLGQRCERVSRRNRESNNRAVVTSLKWAHQRGRVFLAILNNGFRLGKVGFV